MPNVASWVTVFSLRGLELIEDIKLGQCGPIYQISSSLSENRLYVARASPNGDALHCPWTQICLDDSRVSEGRPIECRTVPEFPSFDDAVHARIISYPDHGRALIARQARFGQVSPESELLMVEVGTGKIIKVLHSVKGYNTALMINDGCVFVCFFSFFFLKPHPRLAFLQLELKLTSIWMHHIVLTLHGN